jgi:AraC family transcriptional regulator, transcriptional activator of pobA
MIYQFQDTLTEAFFSISVGEPIFEHRYFAQKQRPKYSIIWNRGLDHLIMVDAVPYPFPANTFMALNAHHSYAIKDAKDMVIWQFNAQFYCIEKHDAEVSCTGVLFYNLRETHSIFPDEKQIRLFGILLEIFADEFGTHDNIQGEMLRMLLKRLIIKLTRLLKQQTILGELGDSELSLVRQFHLLIEEHFRSKHQVKDYADLLHKSPKTLSNLFIKYSQTSPLQMIQERLFLESKRLLLFTDMTAGEISQAIGFKEAAHFSRFFKLKAKVSPSEFKRKVQNA